MDNRIVYVVHAVDTEGPLYESLAAKFERLRETFAVQHEIEPTWENFRKLQRGDIPLDGKEAFIASAFSSHLVDYNDTWEKLDRMLFKIMSPDFRNKLPDSFGGGWVYNWHCMDHVGYEVNPRRRDIGYHNIFDHYRDMIERTGSHHDGLHWHFHPMSTYREAHRCATSYVNSPHLYESLCRRIIERRWFPAVFRAGFQAERPDSHLFLEQWIPFDLSNMAKRDDAELLEMQADLKDGRFGDWRLAPDDWSVYQPDHDNYQLKGRCRRWIGRSLNLRTRIGNITQEEVDKAFARAEQGLPTLMGLNNHDWRDMSVEIEDVRVMIEQAARKFPSVRFKYSEAVQAFRNVVYGSDARYEPLQLSVELRRESGRLGLVVDTVAGQVFGPQPFLAIKTRSQRFIHDNFDFDTSRQRWFYAFDCETVLPDDIAEIGVAANDRYGYTVVKALVP
ncbi:MAG: hypothetical protein AUH74_00140 [Nitrospirae bacterium 13_1_40CM_4_62_6]|nr:MAG: hypothetical protein AUH74_00140 [Nitrospirae bacterium 13_1_40CM_4_62_6]